MIRGCARGKYLTVAAILSLFFSLLANPRFTFANEVPDKQVSIRVEYLPLPGDIRPDAIARRAVMQAYLERNPHLNVEPFVMPRMVGAAMDMAPLMGIAAKMPPHGIYVNFRQSSTYVNQGFLEPLEILLARLWSDDEDTRKTDSAGNWLADPTDAEIEAALVAIKSRVNDRVWPVIYRADESKSGRFGEGRHVWAMPTGTLVMALWYRKDLYAAAGLDPERPPENWDELLDYAQKLTIPERNQYGLGMAPGQALSWSTYTFLVSNGARAVRETEEGNWEAAYGSREAAEAISFVWDLVNKPFQRDGQTLRGTVRLNTDYGTAWERGQLGMQFGYLQDELLGSINPQLVGIAPVPANRRGERGSELNCTMLGVFSGSTPEQKLAVAEMIWYMSSDEALEIRTRSYVEAGFGTFVSPDLLRKFGYERIVRLIPESWATAFEAALDNGVPEPYGRNTQNIYRYMSEPIESALELDLEGVPEEERIRRIEVLLKASAAEVNTEVMGNLPPETLTKRRIVGSIVLFGVIGAFVFGFLHVWRYFTSIAQGGEDRPFRRYGFGYVLLIPAIALTLLWLYVPLAGGLGVSVLDYRLELPSQWVGVDNFATVLFDERFWAGFGRTLYFVALTIGLGFWPPILLAILLDEVPTSTLKYIFRTLFYLPAIISGVVIMFLWKELYTPTQYGVLNQLLMSVNELGPITATLLKIVFGGLWIGLIALLFTLPIKIDEMARPLKTALFIVAGAFTLLTVIPFISSPSSLSNLWGTFNMEPLRWSESPELAMLCVVLPTVWAGAGPGCLLYLAALKTIPNDLYEAAEIDGATFWHKVFYVTLPRLKFLIGIQFIAALVGAFKGGTDFILALTGGGPNNATMILALEIFMKTFANLSFGLGAAMAWILGAALIGLTAYQLKMLARAEFTAGGSR